MKNLKNWVDVSLDEVAGKNLEENKHTLPLIVYNVVLRAKQGLALRG